MTKCKNCGHDKKEHSEDGCCANIRPFILCRCKNPEPEAIKIIQ